MRSDLDRMCERLKITAESKYGAAKPNPEFKDSHPYKVTLRFQGRRLTVDFYVGSAHTNEPTPADVLSCLCSDVNTVENSRSFEEWAGDLGYEPDSRRAERIFKTCEALAPKVRRFLGAAFEDVSQASH